MSKLTQEPMLSPVTFSSTIESDTIVPVWPAMPEMPPRLERQNAVVLDVDEIVPVWPLVLTRQRAVGIEEEPPMITRQVADGSGPDLSGLTDDYWFDVELGTWVPRLRHCPASVDSPSATDEIPVGPPLPDWSGLGQQILDEILPPIRRQRADGQVHPDDSPSATDEIPVGPLLPDWTGLGQQTLDEILPPIRRQRADGQVHPEDFIQWFLKNSGVEVVSTVLNDELEDWERDSHRRKFPVFKHSQTVIFKYDDKLFECEFSYTDWASGYEVEAPTSKPMTTLLNQGRFYEEDFEEFISRSKMTEESAATTLFCEWVNSLRDSDDDSETESECDWEAEYRLERDEFLQEMEDEEDMTGLSREELTLEMYRWD